MSGCVYDNDLSEWEQMEETGLKTVAESEDVEERIVMIYEGAENYTSQQPNCDLQIVEDATQTQSKTASEQKPQQVCCSNRSLTAVSLSLSLLCFFLLAGITTLALYSSSLLQKNISFVEKQQQVFNEVSELSNFCKDGSCQSLNQSFYYISTKTKTWDNSRQACIDRHADLIVINSREEQEFVTSLRQTYWIGLSDREEEGIWKWVDGSILNNTGLWVSKKPSGGNKAKNCIKTYMWASAHFWEDVNCDSYNLWICEKNINV